MDLWCNASHSFVKLLSLSPDQSYSLFAKIINKEFENRSKLFKDTIEVHALNPDEVASHLSRNVKVNTNEIDSLSTVVKTKVTGKVNDIVQVFKCLLVLINSLR